MKRRVVMGEVGKGDQIVIHTEDDGDIFARCTGVTHNNLVHYMREEDGCPIAGFVGRQWVDKVNGKSS